MSKEKFDEYIAKAKDERVKKSLFAFAADANEDGLMFLLKSRGYPPHKAFKDAIRFGHLKLALRLFEQRKPSAMNLG